MLKVYKRVRNHSMIATAALAALEQEGIEAEPCESEGPFSFSSMREQAFDDHCYPRNGDEADILLFAASKRSGVITVNADGYSRQGKDIHDFIRIVKDLPASSRTPTEVDIGGGHTALD